MSAQFAEIGKQFVTHYYNTFDTNRSALHSLYQDTSMLTFEGDQFLGATAILQKLTTLQFQTVAHKTTSVDCQPGPAGSIVVFVTGQLAVDASPNPLQFSQTFQLMPNGGSWYVHNDMFRLNLN